MTIDPVEKFTSFCCDNLELDGSLYAEPYRSFSPEIIDCIYSLRAKYFAVTVPVVNRYADRFMNGDRYADGDDLKDLIAHIDECGGCIAFAHDILKNHQKLSGRFKAEVCYELAKKLTGIHIKTIEDFQNFQYIDILESVIRSVKGIGDAGLNFYSCLQAIRIAVSPTCISIIVSKTRAVMILLMTNVKNY